MDLCNYAYGTYNELISLGIPAEDARDVLPHATKTEIVSSMNIRMWRHVIRERGMNPHAQWQIRQLFLAVLYELHTYIPVFFRDLVEELAQRKEKVSE
jgi:thymidylate synthase (FAD)